ncbi:MAG TPA: RluA family pseudouridine synthase [Acidobacteria bacterium]|nr:RluA family pseudouridine synthase [Acidobacteriota bacterium]
MINYRFEVGVSEIQRLDLFLKDRLKKISRSKIQKAIKGGQVTVDGLTVKSGHKLKPGEVVEILTEESTPDIELEPQEIKLNIIYEDSQVIVIDKPAGLTVHPGAGQPRGTLVNGLVFFYPEIKNVGSPLRPGIVHRLDKDTSGLMVVARTQAAYHSLRRQFEDRSVEKVYLGLAAGRFKDKKGIIDLPVGRHPAERQKMSVKSRKPRVAITRYEVLREFKHSTLLALKPLTGRTHQLRVHLSALGHPLLGDSRYGQTDEKKRKPGSRLFLHAFELSFEHPVKKERLKFRCPLPANLQEILDKEAAARK